MTVMEDEDVEDEDLDQCGHYCPNVVSWWCAVCDMYSVVCDVNDYGTCQCS
jgi:hypothetical protein